MEVQHITQLSAEVLQPLLQTSLAEGYTFVRRLWHEYETGINRFETPGGTLMGAYENDTLIAIGGIHIDPYLNTLTIGRVRHVYVMPGHRRNGVGHTLVKRLLQHASEHFETATLRTLTDHGRAFYTTLGVSSEPRYKSATHWIDLREQDSS